MNDIEKILELFTNRIVKGFIDNQKIELRGFGTFNKKINKEKFVRNPKTNEKIFKKKPIKYILKSARFFIKELIQ